MTLSNAFLDDVLARAKSRTLFIDHGDEWFLQAVEQAKALTWTKVAPTEPGQYWYRKRKDAKPQVVLVMRLGRGLCAFTASDVSSVKCLSGEWSDRPIALPAEPESEPVTI